MPAAARSSWKSNKATNTTMSPDNNVKIPPRAMMSDDDRAPSSHRESWSPKPSSPPSSQSSNLRSKAASVSDSMNAGMGAGGGATMMQSDPELKEIMDKLNLVQNYRQLQAWKGTFLGIFESYLEGKGGDKAQAAYDNFRTSMAKFVKKVKSVYRFVELGDLTKDRTTVKGRNALNEASRWMKDIMEEERRLVPAKKSEERQCGYSKYHLGAVLVRDNFSEFNRMNDCNDILQALGVEPPEDLDPAVQNNHCKGGLVGVADPQILKQIQDFGQQMQSFRDVMADLGLYEVMMKCFEFGEQGEEFIFVDLKTGRIGSLPMRLVLNKGAVHATQDEKGNDVGFEEAITEAGELRDVASQVRQVLQSRLAWMSEDNK